MCPQTNPETNKPVYDYKRFLIAVLKVSNLFSFLEEGGLLLSRFQLRFGQGYSPQLSKSYSNYVQYLKVLPPDG